MSFYGVTTAHTKSFLLVKKSCKEILLFFDKQNLPGVIWSSNLHCLFTPCKTESCYIQPNTFEVPTLECYSRQGLREQGSNSPCPISNIPPFCPGHTFPEVSWEQLWSGSGTPHLCSHRRKEGALSGQKLVWYLLQVPPHSSQMPVGINAWTGCVLWTSGRWELNLGTDLWEKTVCDSYESKKLREHNWDGLNRNE